MLATSPEIKKPTGHGRFFSGVITALNSPRWLAITITLAIHLLVLWLAIYGRKSLLPDDSIASRLHYIELPPEEKITELLTKPATIDFYSIDTRPLPNIVHALPPLTLEPEPLTPQELESILGPNDWQQNNTAEIAQNVFHPGLRKQLTLEANKPVLARVEDRGLETYMDPSGATIVVSGSGSCLRSPPVKIGEPRNWYMTPCAGKNESEKITDRVNETVNGKLKIN